MRLLTWDHLWLCDSKVLHHARRCYPFNNLIEENRAGNLLCCFPSYLARLPTLILLCCLLLPLSALPLHIWALWSFLPLTGSVPFPSPHFKHLHVSVIFSLKLLLSIVCFSQITSSQDKNRYNKTPFDRVRQQQHLFSFSRLLPVLRSELTLTECRSDLVATACPPQPLGGCEIWQPRQPFSYLAYTCAV